MKALIPAVFIIVLFLGPLWLFLRHSSPRPERRLSRPERRELESLRTLRDDLQDMAAEHIAIGDPFAAIVSDTIRQQKRELK